MQNFALNSNLAMILLDSDRKSLNKECFAQLLAETSAGCSRFLRGRSECAASDETHERVRLSVFKGVVPDLGSNQKPPEIMTF